MFGSLVFFSVFVLHSEFSPTWPPGPSWSVSHNVCMNVCMYIFNLKLFFPGLSLALRSHDPIPASHWSPPPLPPEKEYYNTCHNFVICKYFQTCQYFGTWGSRRKVVYADIPVQCLSYRSLQARRGRLEVFQTN